MFYSVRFEIYYFSANDKVNVKVSPDMLFTCEYNNDDKVSYNDYLDMRDNCVKLCKSLDKLYASVRLVEVSRRTLFI